MGNLFNNWDISRWIMLGVLFVGLAVLNKGCCCGGCSAPTETKAIYKDFVKPYQTKKN